MRIVISFACALTMHLLITTASWARELYVSNTGRDDNPGTMSRPFASLDKVRAMAKSGDNVYLERGSRWVAQFNVPASHMSIDAYGEGAAPIIEGTSAYFSIEIAGKSYVTIRNLNLVNANNDCLRINVNGAVTRNITIENNIISGCSNDAIDFSPTDADIDAGYMPFGIKVLNNKISNCGNAAVQVRALSDAEENRIAFNRIDNVGTRYATNAISLGYVHNLIVESNTITNTRSTEIDGSGITADYLKKGNRYGSGTIIRGNDVECPAPPVNKEQAGIAVWFQPNVEIYDNTIKNCNDGIRVSGRVSSGYDIHNNNILGVRKRGAAFTSSAALGRFYDNSMSGDGADAVGIWVNRGAKAPDESNNNMSNFRIHKHDANR